MTSEPLIALQIHSGNKFLWAVKTYIDLISRDDNLVFGSGLKRLYAMASGVATYNEADIEAIAEKSERIGLMQSDLYGFMVGSILKNLELYGKELQKLIVARILSISNGEVRNPDPMYKYSPEEARRYFYTPASSFVVRLQKALNEDSGSTSSRSGYFVANSIQDVANDADFLLARAQLEEGHSSPIETSWGALMTCVEGLVSVLEDESRLNIRDRDYKTRSRGAVKVLWFIAKLLLGDLTVTPLGKDVNLVDLDKSLNLTDGTLAAIPFPLRETVSLFSDADGNGITLRGRMYLNAVSAAAFYKSYDNSEG